MALPLLELTTTQEQLSILIDGKAYRLVSPMALSLPSYFKFSKLAGRLQALWNSDVMSDQECTELEDVLDRLCRLILEGPAEVHAKLNDLQRMDVYQAFLALQSAGTIASDIATVTGTEQPKPAFTPKRRTKH